MIYKVEKGSHRLEHYKQDRLFIISLPPGYSCIFPVLSSYLKKSNVICVPFRYAWEDSTVGINAAMRNPLLCTRPPSRMEKAGIGLLKSG